MKRTLLLAAVVGLSALANAQAPADLQEIFEREAW